MLGGVVTVLSERFLPSFKDLELEAAYQADRTAWAAHRGRLAIAAVASLVLIVALLTSADDSAMLWFQRANGIAQLLYWGTVGLLLTRRPERVAPRFDMLAAMGLLHLSVVCGLTHDRISAILNVEPDKLRPAFFLEADSAVLLCGVLLGGPLLLRLSPGYTFLLNNLAVFSCLALRLALGSLEWEVLASSGSFHLPSETGASLVFVLEVYIFALLACTLRYGEDAEARSAFAASRGPQNQQQPLVGGSSSADLTKVRPSCQKGSDVGVPVQQQAVLSEVRPDVLTAPHPPPLRAAPAHPGTVVALEAVSDDSLCADLFADSPKQSSRGGTPAAPNPRLISLMAGRTADWDRIRRMAERIQTPRYGLREYFEDCLAAFPELSLFTAGPAPDSAASGAAGASAAACGRPAQGGNPVSASKSSSGDTNEAEYQRTIGALFAVYWLLRLPVDGRVGWCYGVDASWAPLKTRRQRGAAAAPSGGGGGGGGGKGSAERTSTSTTASILPEPGLTFGQMTEEQKRASFLETMNWSMFENLVQQAGCDPLEVGSTQRIMAVLCLTAFHDIMKLQDLLPTVQAEHAPYLGHRAGDVIRDHDVALSYVLEHYPQLLPSYAGLPERERRIVLFSQGRMNFNHGWFVQAEAPPGAMLTAFKSVLQAGATPADIGFYFLHWFTDLAGAEATPLGGSEKFVLRFPHAVLASFLWSIPFLGKLTQMSETAVVESYLRARWQVLAPDSNMPDGEDAIACMRLAVMAQSDDRVVTVFQSLPHRDRATLTSELARTGCVGQRFAGNQKLSGGPALLVYYSPALLQKNADGNIYGALRVLAEVFRVGRALWPSSKEEEGGSATVQIAALKGETVDKVVERAAEEDKTYVLRRHNDLEGIVELLTAAQQVELTSQGIRYQALNIADSLHGPPSCAATEVFSDEEDGTTSCGGTSSGGVIRTAGRSSVSSRAPSEEGTLLPLDPISAFPDLKTNRRGTLGAESELAGLRQENWLLRDRVEAMSTELGRVRMKLLELDPDSLSNGPCGGGGGDLLPPEALRRAALRGTPAPPPCGATDSACSSAAGSARKESRRSSNNSIAPAE